MEINLDEWKVLKAMSEKISEDLKGLEELEKDVKEVNKATEQNRDLYKKIEYR